MNNSLVSDKEKKTMMRVQDHPAFGMYKNRKISVQKEVQILRTDRFKP